jgi:hypothetical protein
MSRLPQITCRPGEVLLDEIDCIVEVTKLSRAEVVRQLTVAGLNQLREGRLVLAQPGIVPKTGKPDRRKSRECGEKISAKRRGRTYKIVGDENEPSPVSDISSRSANDD